MKKIILILLAVIMAGSAWGQKVISMYVSTKDTKKTLNPDIKDSMLADVDYYTCEYTKDKKGVTITAYYKVIKKDKIIKGIEKEKITAVQKVFPTPTVTPTVKIK